MKETTPITKKRYQDGIPKLQTELGEKNLLALPRVMKVVVNVGIGRLLKESSRVEEVVATLAQITGQKPVMTKARKAIAGFKIREDMEVGIKVTLRGRRMWQFLDRLLNATIPRVRDFQGIPISSVDQGGNCNIGLKEHMVFPEIVQEKVQTIFGLQITIVSTAKDKKAGEALFRMLGVPFRTEEDK